MGKKDKKPILQGNKALIAGLANRHLIAYLATPYARRMTGETLYVDGVFSIMA